MKRFLTIITLLAMVLSLSACMKSDEKKFEDMKTSLEAAGYEVRNTFVDSTFEGVVSAFSFKVSIGKDFTVSIPVVLTDSKASATKNCAMFGEESPNKPIQNGRFFSYPAKGYPQSVLDLVEALLNGEDISKK
ncbi:MAG: hypothetical protein IKU65_03615 [Oscillospiraceae bacterium]|nr:hypothetical protein [Oscillospiraceae bacterium]